MKQTDDLEKDFLDDLTEQDVVRDKYTTALRKVQFINELKGGLGVAVKANPKPKLIKKTWYQKLSIMMKRMFTKF